MKKFIALLLFLAGGSLLLFVLSLAGCRSEKVSFIYKSFSTEVNEENSGRYTVINAFDTCSYPRYFIRLQLETTQLMALLPGIGNKVYANTYETRYRNLEKITDIKIITLHDYNAQYPAGADMSKDISFRDDAVYGSNTLKEEQLLTLMNRNYNTFFSEEPVKIFSFRPAVAPAAASLQQFAIEFMTDKNAVIRDTTITYILKP